MDWGDFSQVPDEEYIAPIFVETRSIRTIHAVPRLGYPSDISLYGSTNTEIRDQYIYGAIYTPSLILIFFLAWFLMLFIFQCFSGFDHLETLSGYAPTLERKTYSGINGNAELKYEETLAKNQMDCTRIKFIISAVLTLVFTLVLYVSGLAALEEAVSAASDEIIILQNKIRDTREQMNLQVEASNSIIPVRDAIYINVTSWCPDIETNFTVSLNDLSFEAQEDVILDSSGNYVAEVDDLRVLLEETYSGLDTMIKGGAETVGKSLELAISNADDLMEEIEEFWWWYYSFIIFIIITIVIILLLLWGVYRASRDRGPDWVEYILKCVVYKCYCFCIPVMFLYTVYCCSFAIISADVCTGSPELNIVAVFNEKAQTMDPLLYSMTKYYVETCMSTPVDITLKPTKFIDDFISYLDQSIANTDQFLNQMRVLDPLVIDSNCGESIEDFAKDLVEFTTALLQFREILTETAASMHCSVFTPTYINIMHDQICTEGVNAFETMCIMFFFITFCGMSMMTYSAAFTAIDYEDDSDNSNASNNLNNDFETHENENDFETHEDENGFENHENENDKQIKPVGTSESISSHKVGISPAMEEIEVNITSDDENTIEDSLEDFDTNTKTDLISSNQEHVRIY